MDWTPLLGFPLEWAALSLLVAGCLYWERAGLSGIGIEGCALSAMLGLCLGYEASGSYWIASAAGVAGAVVFAALAGVLILALKADPMVGSFALSLIPACGLGLLARGTPLRLLSELPSPGLIPGTIFEGSEVEDLLASPWLLAAPLVLALAAFVLLRTPYGLRLRAHSETPALARGGWAQVMRARLSGAVLGALWVAPVAPILLRAHPDAPPLGLGFVALACAIAGRWAFVPGILLAAGPALLRAAKPYAYGTGVPEIVSDAAPFLLAAIYLLWLSRRALRASATRQSRLDPDVL